MDIPTWNQSGCEKYLQIQIKSSSTKEHGKKEGTREGKEGAGSHLYSHFLINLVGMLWPFDHAHHSVGHGLCGWIVALGEGQEESQDPDDTDDHLGGCGRQPGLEGVDDGHVPGMEKKGQNSSLVTKICIRDYALFLPSEKFLRNPLSPGDFYDYSNLKLCDFYDMNAKTCKKNQPGVLIF